MADPLKYYQNITGEKGEHTNRVGSAYWGEGRWNNYIKPLLPTKHREDMSFLDIGANNGLFLKLAKDANFRLANGVDASLEAVERGVSYRDSLGYDYKLTHRTVGDDFSFKEFPLSDVVLISAVHYYFQLQDWLNFVDEMFNRTIYCVIITRPVYRAKHHWRPKTGITDTKYYFRDWTPIRSNYRIRKAHKEKAGDPSPRVLWSMKFKSRLNRVSFDDLIKGAPGDKLKLCREELIEKAIKNPDLDVTKTNYYKTFRKRMSSKWDEERTRKFTQEKVDLITDIKENGQRQPVLIDMAGKIIDGGHRVEIMKALRYNSVICRTI